FEPEQDIQKFIREFILEAAPIDVREVRTAVSAYRETQERLEKQEAEAGFLKRISGSHEACLAARREEAIWSHLRHAVDHAQARELVERHRADMQRLLEKNAADAARFEAQAARKAELETQYNAVVLEAQNDPDAAKLKGLRDEKRRLLTAINSLNEAQKAIRERLKNRAGTWWAWIKQGAELPLDGLKAALAIDETALDALRGADEQAALNALPRLAEQFNEIVRQTEKLLRPTEDASAAALARLQEIAKALERLERKETPGSFPLFHALRDKLAHSDTPPEQLCRLIEVADDEWREALELFLGRNRFAVIVSPSDYGAALEILRKTPPGREGESLVHPREALELSAKVKPGSLAEKVTVADPVARQFTNHLLGGVAAVGTVSELDGHDRGITRDGVFKQAPVRRRLRQIPGFEFTLGQEGLKRLREAAFRDQRALMAEREALDALRERVAQWLQGGRRAELGDPRLPDRSHEIKQLPEMERRLQQLGDEIEIISTPERESRLDRLRELKNELDRAIESIGGMRESQTAFETSRNRIQEALDGALEDFENAERMLVEKRTQIALDITNEELDMRLGVVLKECTSWKERIEVVQHRAAAAGVSAANHRHARNSERRALAAAVDANGLPAHPQYRADCDDEDESNALWDARLALLEQTELPKYRAMADERRREWEGRLQSQVIDKLAENLQKAQGTIRQLRQYLDRPIGKYRYQIEQSRDSAFAAVWHLIDTGFNPGDELMGSVKTEEIERAKAELMAAVEKSGTELDERSRQLLDHRQYHRYDLHMIPANRPDAPAISLGRHGHKLSGGENQAPFFLSMLAAFHRVYDLGGGQYRQNMGLVIMDEAFSKLSGDGVEDCLTLARNFQLQLIMAFPVDRLGMMAPYAKTIIHCRKEEQRDSSGYVTRIDNIPTVLTPEEVQESLE
ncbi:MAG: SbcC/MukB-like Walker B domain-containing protein, partial [Chthoniobacteraceae bacterium]|nr:SbcC/MukB-like Walker B domain-containing protein [Chthoniobacteraceae bacterium]